jgi:acyl-CoA oxidase
VVVADLLLDGTSFGPHAFLLSLRQGQEGPLVPGVTVGDMGPKTVGNDLDNAWVSECIGSECIGSECIGSE